MKKTILISGLIVAALQMSCATKCYEPTGDCALIPDPGPCEALIPKYYFDQESGECKEFFWGGCDGVVPFDTMEECEECLEGR